MVSDGPRPLCLRQTDSESDEESEELRVEQVEEAPGDGHHRQTVTLR